MKQTEIRLTDESRAMLRRMPDLAVPALFRGMKKAMIRVEARARSPYLTGRSLNVRTGHLRRSIVSGAQIDGDTVTGHVGTNVSYGRFWELGYHGPMSVRSHLRQIRQAFGRPIDPRRVRVRAHIRQVHQDPRPFLRPAIEDTLDKTIDTLARSIRDAFNQQGPTGVSP